MKERRDILLRPLRVWGALLGFGLLSLGYARTAHAPAKPAVALAITLAQAALVLGLFMNLGRSSTLVRVTAMIAVMWLGFLFLMSFADLWTR